MKKIAFILTTLDAHAVHRVNDFVAHGFDVQVNTFVRVNAKQTIQTDWKVNVIGEFPNALPYHKRIQKIIQGIRLVSKQYKGCKDVVFYYLGLDIAMFACPLIRRPYIFEECDLNHTYIGNKIVCKVMEKIDCFIIRHSLQTIFTSEGFFTYHQLKDTSNVTLIPNKLPASIWDVPEVKKHAIDANHLSFGFAGDVRYENIVNFASVLVRNFPMHEFHFFGTIQERVKSLTKELEQFPNCHFHGRFRSPDDLPEIYSQLDFTLATYDTRFENVCYAEPNKIYEAIFFRTPIIVSRGTFLQQKCEKLGLGTAVDALSEDDVVSFVKGLTREKIDKMYADILLVPQESAIDNNDAFFAKLKTL